MGKWDEAIEAGSGDMWDQTGKIEGVYIAKRTDVGPNDSNVYLIRTTDEDGEPKDIGVWGSTVLDGKFDDIPLKSEVQVEFLGLSEKKGKFGKPYKEYRVRFLPPSAQAETAAAPAKAATEPADEGSMGEKLSIDRTVSRSTTPKASPDDAAPEGEEDLGLDKDY